MGEAVLSPDERGAVEALASDLRRIFGDRMYSLVVYGLHHRDANDPGNAPLHTLALVEALRFADLAACVPLVPTWERRGLAAPLLLMRDEFDRSLDAFPLEYGDIVAHHVLIAGNAPFEGCVIADADLRRACEQQVKSHLIHLREGYMECGGRPDAVARLIAHSARPFRVLLGNIARLERLGDGDDSAAALGVPADLVRDVLAVGATRSTIVDPTALVSRYITALEQLWTAVDTWRGRPNQ